MQFDSEVDKNMILKVMREATIPGAIAAQYALLMNRVAKAEVVPPEPTKSAVERAAEIKKAVQARKSPPA